MKNSYSISYLFVISALSLLLVVAFSYNHNQYETNYLSELSQVDSSIIENTNINSGYYLRVNGDYVIVYLYDNNTVFEETEILMSTLSESLQREIINGKYVPTTVELYGFLENFSS